MSGNILGSVSVSYSGGVNECKHKGLFVGSHIIMDNVGFSHWLEWIELIENSGAIIMFLLAYSPYQNPIGNVFRTIKANLNSIRPTVKSKEIL